MMPYLRSTLVVHLVLLCRYAWTHHCILHSPIFVTGDQNYFNKVFSRVCTCKSPLTSPHMVQGKPQQKFITTLSQTENCCSSGPHSQAGQISLPWSQKHSSKPRSKWLGTATASVVRSDPHPSRVAHSLDSPAGLRLNQKTSLCLQHHSKLTSFQKGCLICSAKLEPNHCLFIPFSIFLVLCQKQTNKKIRLFLDIDY